MVNRIRVYLTLILLTAGALLVVKSGYYYTRGVLAQILLDHAWEESKRTGRFIKAWNWADTFPIGKLSIPSINVSRVVLADSNNESLAFGPAHISVSSRPGEHGNIAIAGHRDSFFRKLGKIRKGETIQLESLNTLRNYVVTDIQIIRHDDTYWIQDTSKDVLTLITCYPFDFVGPAPQRYIVRGNRYYSPHEVHKKKYFQALKEIDTGIE